MAILISLIKNVEKKGESEMRNKACNIHEFLG